MVEKECKVCKKLLEAKKVCKCGKKCEVFSSVLNILFCYIFHRKMYFLMKHETEKVCKSVLKHKIVLKAEKVSKSMIRAQKV